MRLHAFLNKLKEDEDGTLGVSPQLAGLGAQDRENAPLGTPATCQGGFQTSVREGEYVVPDDLWKP